MKLFMNLLDSYLSLGQRLCKSHHGGLLVRCVLEPLFLLVRCVLEPLFDTLDLKTETFQITSSRIGQLNGLCELLSGNDNVDPGVVIAHPACAFSFLEEPHPLFLA